MIISVPLELQGVSIFPSGELEDIAQCVRTVLTTAKWTVPLDRDFGIDTSIVDAPSAIAKPLILNAVKEALEKYEPRVKFVGIEWSGEAENGVFAPKVKVAIK